MVLIPPCESVAPARLSRVRAPFFCAVACARHVAVVKFFFSALAAHALLVDVIVATHCSSLVQFLFPSVCLLYLFRKLCVHRSSCVWRGEGVRIHVDNALDATNRAQISMPMHAPVILPSLSPAFTFSEMLAFLFVWLRFLRRASSRRKPQRSALDGTAREERKHFYVVACMFRRTRTGRGRGNKRVQGVTLLHLSLNHPCTPACRATSFFFFSLPP